MGERTQGALCYARRGHEMITHSHRGGRRGGVCTHENMQNVSSRTKRGGEVSVMLCVGVSHFHSDL